jgi:uncharacterized protein
VLALICAIPIIAALAAENAMRTWKQPADAALAEAISHATASKWEAVRVSASDGIPLEAWVFTPVDPNGSAAIVIHGVGDTRSGMFERAMILVRARFTVAMPDLRGHGSSGGDIVTYGIREAGDVHEWAEWLFRNRRVNRLYGYGLSMGGAILLQSLPLEPRFRAIVAEAPFFSFEEVAFDRMYWPLVKLGLLYTRARHRLDLTAASPIAAIRNTRVPVLLIHGDRDTNVPIRHSRALAAANPGAVRLWEVPGAGHLDIRTTAGRRYESALIEWFQ